VVVLLLDVDDGSVVAGLLLAQAIDDHQEADHNEQEEETHKLLMEAVEGVPDNRPRRDNDDYYDDKSPGRPYRSCALVRAGGGAGDRGCQMVAGGMMADGDANDTDD